MLLSLQLLHDCRLPSLPAGWLKPQIWNDVSRQKLLATACVVPCCHSMTSFCCCCVWLPQIKPPNVCSRQSGGNMPLQSLVPVMSIHPHTHARDKWKCGWYLLYSDVVQSLSFAISTTNTIRSFVRSLFTAPNECLRCLVQLLLCVCPVYGVAYVSVRPFPVESTLYTCLMRFHLIKFQN